MTCVLAKANVLQWSTSLPTCVYLCSGVTMEIVSLSYLYQAGKRNANAHSKFLKILKVANYDFITSSNIIYQTLAVTFWKNLTSFNRRWWWKSFFCAAGTGLYVFAYGIFFYYTKVSYWRLLLNGYSCTFLKGEKCFRRGVISVSYHVAAIDQSNFITWYISDVWPLPKMPISIDFFWLILTFFALSGSLYMNFKFRYLLISPNTWNI